jgi:hypothetical protein
MQIEGRDKLMLKKIGNYKSKRFLSDLALLRGTKLFKKPQYNFYE